MCVCVCVDIYLYVPESLITKLAHICRVDFSKHFRNLCNVRGSRSPELGEDEANVGMGELFTVVLHVAQCILININELKVEAVQCYLTASIELL